MALKKRFPMQVSPVFHERINQLKKRIRMKTGEDPSLRDLTEQIVTLPEFEDLEKRILNVVNSMDIKIKLDKRSLL